MVNVVLNTGQVHFYEECWVRITSNDNFFGTKTIEVISEDSVTMAKYTNEIVIAVIEHEGRKVTDFSGTR